jgi:outer membrane protein TolC
MKRKHLRRTVHLATLGAVAIIASFFVGGCQRDIAEDTVPPRVQARLTHIETITPQELSASPPAPLTEATTQPLDQPAATRPAPQAVEITLPEVRAAALANNLDLQAELFNPAIAGTFIDQEEAKFESLIFGSASHTRRNSTTQPTAGTGGPDEFQSFDLGLQVPLRTGGVATVSVPFDRLDGGDQYQAGLEFSISQPLLRNAGARVNTHSIRLARYATGAVAARTKLAAIRILANADRVYWLLYAASAELKVRQQQYELALRQLNEAKLRVAARAAARIEITRAESGLAARLEEIIIAETIVKRRERELKVIMHRPDLPVGSRVPLIPATPPNPVNLELRPDTLALHAVANRMEMLELELQLAADASEIEFQRDQTLPLFVLDYTYSIAGSGTRSYRAFDAAADLDNRESFIGLRAEVPVGNQAAHARVNRAVLERLQRLATRDLRRLSIEQEVFDVADQLTQNWQRILAARNEALLAARTYEAERRQFELNVRTSTDVLDAAARLADAQSREVQALTDYEISLVDLAFATGTLLGHGRILLTNDMPDNQQE